jgi:dienelactone hydrolase
MTGKRQCPTTPGSASASSLTIDAPSQSRNDGSIPIRVRGAAPGDTVVFEASLTDDDGIEWSAHLRFTANGDGRVDLTEDAPDAGSYDGIEPMGWLWAMGTDADALLPSLGRSPRISVRLRAETDDQRTERTITRVVFDDDITERAFETDGLRGTLYVPAGEGPHPGVVELHGSGGRNSDAVAKLLATHGFATLAVEYFGNDARLPDRLEGIELTRFDEAVAWLRGQPDVDASRVGLVGSSRGAELALLLGAHYDWVGAVVSYAGSIPWDTPSDAPAWLLDGEPVSHIAADGSPAETVLDEKPLDSVVPPVERTNGPVLLLSGGADRVWPARRLSNRIVDRLDSHEFLHDYEHLTYDGVGHLIGTPYAPLSGIDGSDRVGGTARATAHAGIDSWPVVLDYLSAGLEKSA